MNILNILRRLSTAFAKALFYLLNYLWSYAIMQLRCIHMQRNCMIAYQLGLAPVRWRQLVRGQIKLARLQYAIMPCNLNKKSLLPK